MKFLPRESARCRSGIPGATLFTAPYRVVRILTERKRLRKGESYRLTKWQLIAEEQIRTAIRLSQASGRRSKRSRDGCSRSLKGGSMHVTKGYQDGLSSSIKKYFSTFLLSLAAILLLVPAAHAQYRTSIQGVVTDTTGAVIPGATLTLTDTRNQRKAGPQQRCQRYLQLQRIAARYLYPGRHKDWIPEEGSRPAATDSRAGRTAINVQLAVGADTQTVTVDASTAPPSIQKPRTTAERFPKTKSSICRRFERDATSLIQLAPGSSGRWIAAGRRRWIPGPRNADRRLIGRRRQSGAFQQYLCHGKWRLGQRQRRPV